MLICYHIGGHVFAYTPNNVSTHLKECDCGYSIYEYHSITYLQIPRDSSAHRVVCTKCGYSRLEGHSYRYLPGSNLYECIYCGYSTRDPGIILYSISITEPIFFERSKENEFV